LATGQGRGHRPWRGCCRACCRLGRPHGVRLGPSRVFAPSILARPSSVSKAAPRGPAFAEQILSCVISILSSRSIRHGPPSASGTSPPTPNLS
jgi:hypothetical protein